MKLVYFLLIAFFLSTTITAQTGIISGKVISGTSGQALQSASVTLIEKSKTVIADQNGNFSFNKLPSGTYSINCSNVSYNAKIVVEIVVKNNENTSLTISLDEKKGINQEIIINTPTVKAARESIASILIAQKNSASVSDGISSEAIRKTPDRSTGDVIKRVSGASIQDDRFAIIRGLNDRYNAAFINGAPLPSTESDRKAFAFDIFPSAILDNLIIYKTATPDKPGDFAGGIIEITTKATSPKNFTSITFGSSYNTLITGKNRYFSQNKGSKDFIGLDDGTRALPAGLPAANVIRNPNYTFAEKAELAKLFGKYKWGIQAGNTSPNVNFQLSNGFNFQKNDREFISTLFSLNYNRNFAFNEGERNTYDFNSTPNAVLDQRKKYKDSVYNEETIVALLGNVSIKLNNSNSISWKNNLSINTDNRLIKRIGENDAAGDPGFLNRDVIRWFTSNQIFSSQLSGEHLAGKFKTKINWLANYSNVERDIPNLSRSSYIGIAPDFSPFFASGEPNQLNGTGTMLFINSKEDIKSVKADITQRYTFLKNSQNSFKAGGGYQARKRDFTTRLIGFAPGGVNFDFSLLSLPEGEIFNPGNLGKIDSTKGGFLINEGTIDNSNYDASSTLSHVYLMNDQRFFKKFRVIYGVRLETFNQKLNSFTEKPNTPPRVVRLDSTVTDVLPSVNFVYSLTSKMNIRLSYSKTVNRPEFRELAPFLFFDYTTQNTIGGLQDLKRAKVKNYDFRYEFYPGNAQLFSFSAFYKDFADPIEVVFIPGTTNQASYINTTSAKVYGVEAEFRTLLSTLFAIKREGALLSKFTLSANAALTKSNITLTRLFSIDPSRLITDRPLQGQSPYLVNGSFAFNDDKSGFSATISVNRVGDRIYIAGIKDESADIYEKARTVIDLQIAKFLLKNKLELKLTARDMLAQDINFYSDFDLSKSYTPSDRFFSTFKAPKVISFSATYKF